MTKRIGSNPPDFKPEPRVVFHRRELNRILSVYGHLVGSGTARDYGISMLTDRAVFAIYRRAAEKPTWTIEKIPALTRKQGAWVVRGIGGQVLKRGHELAQVIKVFDRYRLKIVS